MAARPYALSSLTCRPDRRETPRPNHKNGGHRMPIVNRFAEFQPDLVAWRHDFHRHPELLYEVHRTAASVAERLRSFGVDDVVTGIGRTGVVGVIQGRQTASGR